MVMAATSANAAIILDDNFDRPNGPLVGTDSHARSRRRLDDS